ncbi:uncharacterized protein TRAVEDRAFT_39512 [Trametes versicolor FP-101664 SS1]|uniref:uncharacterized protein n=1 Tax=Trametes versicolor (strain FP-101664) TaxID=717944 RepID=UPI0004623612|nr:uncharacterized protein TRAVEDRAFT_39512 [Trametes versicolor FP-101664 SS1]EIW55211.1 hypothetical protein TRAVEDRAFT_39512 [Trametes versicolor FP-101664 SS1]
MSAISTTAVPHQDSAMRQRPIGDMLSQQFAPFDHRSKVVAPFDDETKRDAAFIEKLNVMLLELILDFHAWSAARPMHESDRTADTLEKEVQTIREAEKEQELTRQRLNDFITRIKLALAALTGLGP